MVSDATCDVREPKSVSDALTNQEWVDAMKAEIDSLHDNSVWELVQLPEGRKPLGSKWVYKVKMNADGSIERCKAHLVAKKDSIMMKPSVQLYDQNLFHL